MEIPTEFIVGASVAVAGVVGALWAKIASVEKSRDDWTKKAFAAKAGERANSVAMRLLLAGHERSEGEQESLPPPSEDEEDEPTAVRRQTDAEARMLIEHRMRLAAASAEKPRKKQTTLRDVSLLKLEQGWDPERPRASDPPMPVAPPPRPFKPKR